LIQLDVLCGDEKKETKDLSHKYGLYMYYFPLLIRLDGMNAQRVGASGHLLESSVHSYDRVSLLCYSKFHDGSDGILDDAIGAAE